MSSTPSSSLVIWRFTDGRAGHDSQSRGLIEAMMELASVEVHDIQVNPKGLERWNPFGKWRSVLKSLPRPDWLIGAGHSTHLPMAVSRWLYGGRSVVIMKPSLPVNWFNWAIIPEHDLPGSIPNVIPVRGALNRIRPVKNKPDHQGLILIGGPSKHTSWDSSNLVDQLLFILKKSPEVSWELTTSRRTPSDFLDDFNKRMEAEFANEKPSINIFPVEKTDRDWVVQRMRSATQIWVTEESISMIYESLTSGAGVGLLNLPPRSQIELSPALKGVAKLAAKGELIYFNDWKNQPVSLPPPQEPFHESERCARLLLKLAAVPYMDSVLNNHGSKSRKAG